MPKPKYIYDERYDERYPADGIYDRCCRSCGQMCPIEELDDEGWCKKCVEREEEINEVITEAKEDCGFK